MFGFTTDVHIIPAAAILAPRMAVQPFGEQPTLSILPASFAISADTTALIISQAPEQIPLRRAA